MKQVRGQDYSCTGPPVSSVAVTTCVTRQCFAAPTLVVVRTATSPPLVTATTLGSKDLDVRVKVCADNIVMMTTMSHDDDIYIYNDALTPIYHHISVHSLSRLFIAITLYPQPQVRAL